MMASTIMVEVDIADLLYPGFTAHHFVFAIDNIAAI